MARWAKSMGVTVIGVVSRAGAVARAEAAGCDAVFVWGEADIPAEVKRLTGGRGVQVVYDGVGKDTFAASIDSLAQRGIMASIGASSGPPPAVEVSTLNTKGSLFLTRPTIVHHAGDVAEYRERAAAVFEATIAGTIRPEIWREFALAEAAAAHAAIEAGGVEGAVLLRP